MLINPRNVKFDKESTKTLHPTFIHEGIQYTTYPSECLNVIQAILDDENEVDIYAEAVK